MCYKKPGPRCSKHAFARVQVISNQGKQDGWTPELNQKLQEAMTEFYTTPDGIEYLRETGDPDMADNYATIRQQRIKLCKKIHANEESIYYQGDPQNTEGTHPEHQYVSAETQLDRTHEIQPDPVERTLY